MAQNVTIAGAQYSDVPAVDLPKTGGGTARFYDVTEISHNLLSGRDESGAHPMSAIAGLAAVLAGKIAATDLAPEFDPEETYYYGIGTIVYYSGTYYVPDDYEIGPGPFDPSQWTPIGTAADILYKIVSQFDSVKAKADDAVGVMTVGDMIAEALGGFSGALATIAFTGSYNDLIDVPEPPQPSPEFILEPAATYILGGVQADPKTNADTIPAHIGSDNKLYVAPTDVSGKESTANRVTVISAASDNSHYPTAKAVYDYIQSLVYDGTVE